MHRASDFERDVYKSTATFNGLADRKKDWIASENSGRLEVGKQIRDRDYDHIPPYDDLSS